MGVDAMGMGMMQKMQREMMKIQEELAKQEVTGSAGGGAVRVRVSGQLDLLGVEIDREVVDPDDVDM
ncbi:MAG: YbaB/EbfC family nucleoid-associated protein, partial [Chloroflexi bacterium]|nr:YbaB/EbfC family nucleoid-associated protein [Chloroflexota bacterium]